MPRKQAIVNDSSAAAAPARAAKPKSTRVNSAKHSKAATQEVLSAAMEMAPAVDSRTETAVIESVVVAEPVVIVEPVVVVLDGVNQSAAADAREEIARIAYGYWEARGYAAGDPLEDWVRAENEYRQQRSL